MKADLRRMGNRTQARRGRSASIGDHAKVWRRTAAITSAYVNPSSIRRPAASPARATEPESAARPGTASAAIAHRVASGEVGRHECPSAGGGFAGFAALLRCPAKAVGHRGRHRYDGRPLHDSTVAVTAARTKERLQLGQVGVNQPRGQPAPGCQAPRSALPPGHAGPVTTTECRHAEQVRQAEPAILGGGWVVRSATRIWGTWPGGAGSSSQLHVATRAVSLGPSSRAAFRVVSDRQLSSAG
jgi:hypothetical protein